MLWVALISLHTLAAIVWVGGMFFILMALRPSLSVLEPAQRIGLHMGFLPRFFRWVWISIAALLVTGYWTVFGLYGSFATTPVHVHIMQTTGLVMVVLFAVLWAGPYARFKKAAAAGDGPAAASALGAIRWIVTTNLILGLLTSAIGAAGAYWI